MKTDYKFLLVLFLLYATSVVAQNDVELSLYGGISTPQSSFAEFAESGTGIGITGNYVFGKRFGIGIDYNIQQHGFINSISFPGLPEDFRSTSSSSGEWKNSTFSIGPYYRLVDSKFFIDAYAYVGFSSVTTPQGQVVTEETGTPENLFLMESQSTSGVGLTSGLKIGYAFNDRWSAYVNPQYVVSQAEVTYLYRDPAAGFFINDGGQQSFSIGQFLESDLQERKLDVAHFNLNLGLRYRFGKPSSKKPKKDKESTPTKEEKEDKQDLKLVITSHKPGKPIRFEKDQKEITFKWKVLGDAKPVKSYLIHIYQTNFWGEYDEQKQVIVERVQKGTSFTFKRPKTSDLDDRELFYSIDVIGLNESEAPTTNEDDRSMQLPPNPPPNPPLPDCFEIQVTNVELVCDDPAYDQSTGWINYTGTVTVANISDQYCGANALIGNLNNPPPIPPFNWVNNQLNYNLPHDFMNGVARDTNNNLMDPLTDWDWSFNGPNNYVIPPGTSVDIPITAKFRNLPGVVDYGVFAMDSTGIESDGHSLFTDDIDDCICDPCESFERAPSVTVQNVTLDGTNHPSHSVLNITQDLFAGTTSINSVKAELVYFEEILPHDPATDIEFFELDPTGSHPKKHLCQICNPTINGLGVFYGTELLNNQGASTPSTRQLNWYFLSPLNMNGGVASQLQIGVPKANPLACCEPEYKFSIRYTFENEECKKCEVLVNYHYQ